MSQKGSLPHRRSWKTVFAWIGCGLLILLTSLFILDGFGAAALRKSVHEARSMGGAITLRELLEARPAWPADKNGAEVILSVSTRPSTPYPNEDKLPVMGGRSTDFAAGRRWPEATAANVKAFLTARAAELSQIDRLRQFDGGRFPVTVAENPMETLLPSMAPLRQAMRLKSLQAIHRGMEGDTSRLSEDVGIMLRGGDLLKDDPWLISVLVRDACLVTTVRTIEQVCGVAAVDDRQLVEIDRLLAPVADENRIALGIRGERACFLGGADYVRTKGNNPNVGLPAAVTIAARFPGASGFLMRDEADGLHYMNRLVAASPDPYRLYTEARAVEQEVAKRGTISLFVQTLMPSLSGAVSIDLKATAELRAARVALAAERYRLAHGRLPRRLADLVPAFLDRLPDDPYAPGSPLRLADRDDQWVVYSVGEDGADAGGELQRDQPGRKTPDCGFMLLAPAARNRPAPPESAPASAPAEETEPSASMGGRAGPAGQRLL
jgi:hypothetical protein